MSALNDIFKQYGVTGSPFVDSLILAHLIPFMISYVNSIVALCSKIVLTIINFIAGYIKNLIKTRMVGVILCTIIIEQDNQIFNFINDTIFESAVFSDPIKNRSSLILHTINFLKNIGKVEYSEHYKKWKQKNRNLIHLNVKYNKKNDSLIDFETRSKLSIVNKEYKFFNFENKVIKISKLVDNKNAYELKITLMDFESKHIKSEKEVYVKFIEKFLIDRFNFKDKIYYKYSIYCVHNEFSSVIRNLITNGLVDSGSGLLKYNDNCREEQIEKENEIIGSNISMQMDCINFTKSDYDYKSHIIFDNNSNIAKDMTNKLNFGNMFSYYYRKYISPNGIALNSYGYFWNGNILYLLSQNGTCSMINIISFGKLMFKKDILECIEKLIKLNINHSITTNKINKKNVVIYKLKDGLWNAYGLDKRSFDTIYLPNNTMEAIRKEIDTFIEKEKLYREMEISYRKGLLLYGPPGTGKTSLVKSLAYEYQLNIYMININDDEINDDSIIDILNSIGNAGNKILLFEDIDSAFADNNKEEIKNHTKILESFKQSKNQKIKKSDNSKEEGKEEKYDIISNNNKKQHNYRRKYLTYSGLLNALDGVLSNQNGVITIMTTNYKEKLGDAFLRPGRIDKMFELKQCNGEQIDKMLTVLINKRNTLFKEIDNKCIDQPLIRDKINLFIKNVTNEKGESNIKPCELQVYILKYIDNIDDIFNNYRELI